MLIDYKSLNIQIKNADFDICKYEKNLLKDLKDYNTLASSNAAKFLRDYTDYLLKTDAFNRYFNISSAFHSLIEFVNKNTIDEANENAVIAIINFIASKRLVQYNRYFFESIDMALRPSNPLWLRQIGIKTLLVPLEYLRAYQQREYIYTTCSLLDLMGQNRFSNTDPLDNYLRDLPNVENLFNAFYIDDLESDAAAALSVLIALFPSYAEKVNKMFIDKIAQMSISVLRSDPIDLEPAIIICEIFESLIKKSLLKGNEGLIELFCKALVTDYAHITKIWQNLNMDENDHRLRITISKIIATTFKLFVKNKLDLSQDSLDQLQLFFNKYAIKNQKFLSPSAKLLFLLQAFNYVDKFDKLDILSFLHACKGNIGVIDVELITIILIVYSNESCMIVEELDKILSINKDFIDHLVKDFCNEQSHPIRSVLFIIERYMSLNKPYVFECLNNKLFSTLVKVLQDYRGDVSLERMQALLCSIFYMIYERDSTWLSIEHVKPIIGVIKSSETPQLVDKLDKLLSCIIDNLKKPKPNNETHNVYQVMIFMNELVPELINFSYENEHNNEWALRYITLVLSCFQHYNGIKLDYQDLSKICWLLRNKNIEIQQKSFELLIVIQKKLPNLPKNVESLIQLEDYSRELIIYKDPNVLEKFYEILPDTLKLELALPVNLFNVLSILLKNDSGESDENRIKLLRFLLAYVKNGNTLNQHLCSILIFLFYNHLMKKDNQEIDELGIQIVYYLLENDNIIEPIDNLIYEYGKFIKRNCLPTFSSIEKSFKSLNIKNPILNETKSSLSIFFEFAVKIYKLKVAGNDQFEIKQDLYENIIEILNELNINEELVVDLIKIIKYSIVNAKILPKISNQLLCIIEKCFYKNTTYKIKLNSSFALCAFIERNMPIKPFTFELLKLYAQGESDYDEQNMSSFDEPVGVPITHDKIERFNEMRESALQTLELYLTNMTPSNSSVENGITDLLEEETFCNVILNKSETIDSKYNVLKQLKNVIKNRIQHPMECNRVLKYISKYCLYAIETLFVDSCVNIEAVIDILKLFQSIASCLNTNQLKVIVKHFSNLIQNEHKDQDLANNSILHIVEILKNYINAGNPIESIETIEILIQSVMNSSLNKENLRFELIDLLEKLKNNQRIPMQMQNKIVFEVICSKIIKNAKVTAMSANEKENFLELFSQKQHCISANTIQIFEIMLDDSKNDTTFKIRNNLLKIIAAKLKSVKKFEVKLFRMLFDSFNKIICGFENKSEFDKNTLLNIINFSSEYDLLNQNLIRNFQLEYLKGTNTMSKIVGSVLLKATQNNLTLTLETVEYLFAAVKSKSSMVHQKQTMLSYLRY